MSKGTVAAMCWLYGTALTSFSAMWALFYFVVPQVWGIQPQTLPDFKEFWVYATLTVAALPILMVVLDVADDEMIDSVLDTGQDMASYLNAVAWVAWTVLVCVALLFILALWDEWIGPYDDDEQDVLPVPLYRRIWGRMKEFAHTFVILALPNKDGEVPD